LPPLFVEVQAVPVAHLPLRIGTLNVREQGNLLLGGNKVLENMDAWQFFMVSKISPGAELFLIVEESAEEVGRGCGGCGDAWWLGTR